MQVEYLATISLPDEGWDVNALEEACFRAARNAAKQLFLRALKEKEENLLSEVDGNKKGKVRRYLITRFGLVVFSRQKLKQDRDGKNTYFCPLDRAVGLEPRQETTLWVKKRACELASAYTYTYREAASLLSAEVGDEISHYSIHRWVQKKGKALRTEEDRKWQAAFERGEVIETNGEQRDIVVTEIDATMIHSQEGKGKNITVKLGIMYSGKELESETAKYKRYRLKEKTVYGGIEDAQKFGEKLYLKGEEKLSLSKAENVLLIGDGDQWIRAIAQGPYYMATYQIDWWHILVKIHQTFSDQPKLVSELVGYLYSGKGKELLDTVKLARLLCDDDEKRGKISDLANYIENNFDGLYGSRSLKDRVEVKRVLVSSSGAMEKNIDTVIGRRFKKQGMSWTKEGASNLLKLRILCYHKNDWEEFWERENLAGASFSPN
jgi:hypothetical protein